MAKRNAQQCTLCIPPQPMKNTRIIAQTYIHPENYAAAAREKHRIPHSIEFERLVFVRARRLGARFFGGNSSLCIHKLQPLIHLEKSFSRESCSQDRSGIYIYARAAASSSILRVHSFPRSFFSAVWIKGLEEFRLGTEIARHTQRQTGQGCSYVRCVCIKHVKCGQARSSGCLLYSGMDVVFVTLHALCLVYGSFFIPGSPFCASLWRGPIASYQRKLCIVLNFEVLQKTCCKCVFGCLEVKYIVFFIILNGPGGK